MRKILIKNGRVWDGYGFSTKDIYIESGRISQMAESIDLPAQYTIDATEKTVLPGLVDMHTHVRGLAKETFSAYPDIGCLPFGVTTAVEAGAEFGDLAFMQAQTVKLYAFCKVRVRDNHAILEETDRLLSKYGQRTVGVKLYFDTRTTPVTDTTPIRELCSYAQERRLQVMIHCSQPPCSIAKIVDVLRPGDILSHAFEGGRHSAYEDDFRGLSMAKEKKVVLDGAFSGAGHLDIQLLAEAIRRGIQPDTISTDLTGRSSFKRGGRYGLTQCMGVARLLGMPEEDVFRSVTTNPAACLGRKECTGRLAVGGDADIAIIRWGHEPILLRDRAGNCLESEMGYRCTHTLINGELVFVD